MRVKNVDMETSALLLVSWIHNIPCVSVGIVTDKPTDDATKKFKGEIPDLSMNKRMLSRLLHEIVSLIIEDKSNQTM